MKKLALELRKLGLRKKEVKVYLAGLKLGPTSAQKLSKEAGISRPTTYNIIEDLEEKGLFSAIKENKKNYYMAESPDKLLGLLKTEKKELEEKEREFIRMISSLKSEYLSKDRNKIKIFEGEKEIKNLEEQFSFTLCKEIFVFSSESRSKNVEERENTYHSIKERLGNLKVKEICPDKLQSKEGWIERKAFSTHEDLGGTLILADKLFFFSYKEKKGFLIENETIVSLFRNLFSLAWKLKSSS